MELSKYLSLRDDLIYHERRTQEIRDEINRRCAKDGIGGFDIELAPIPLVPAEPAKPEDTHITLDTERL